MSYDEKFMCGIDIGTKNMGFCFVSKNRIVAYRGTVFEFYRYEIGKKTELFKRKDDGDFCNGLVEMIFSIEEFNKTTSIKIEKQLALHNNEILRYDGIVYGTLRGKYPGANVVYTAPRSRTSALENVIEQYDEFLDKEINKSYKATKVPSLIITKNFFPTFYELIMEEIDDKKLDDICDALIYAILETEFFPYLEK